MAVKKFVIALAVLCGAAAVPPAAAKSFSAETTKSGSYVHVPAGEVMTGGLLVTGAAVVVDGDVQGDLIAFGASVVINGNVTGDVLACGAEVAIRGAVAGDVQSYGATVTTDGDIGGSLKVSGAAVSARGRVAGETEVGGAAVWLGGDFGRGVKAEADYLALEDGARVAGDLAYRAGRLDRAPSAAVAGKVRILPPTEKKAEERKFNFGWWIIKNVWAILALFVCAALISWLAPTLLPAAAEQIRGKPWATLGLGAAVFVGAPLAVIVLALTVVGIPSALILGGVYVVALYTARVFNGVFLGRVLTGVAFKGKSIPSLFAALVGIIVLVLLGNIPVFKIVLGVAVDVVACGALAFYVWRRRRVTG